MSEVKVEGNIKLIGEVQIFGSGFTKRVTYQINNNNNDNR